MSKSGEKTHDVLNDGLIISERIYKNMRYTSATLVNVFPYIFTLDLISEYLLHNKDVLLLYHAGLDRHIWFDLCLSFFSIMKSGRSEPDHSRSDNTSNDKIKRSG